MSRQHGTRWMICEAGAGGERFVLCAGRRVGLGMVPVGSRTGAAAAAFWLGEHSLGIFRITPRWTTVRHHALGGR